MHVQVVFADVSQPLAVGREFRVVARIGGSCELYAGPGGEVEIPELSLGVEEQVLGVRRPDVGRDVVARDALFLALVLDLVERRRKLGQLDLAHQDFLLTGRGVHIPELAVIARVIALHERDFGAVGTPLDGLGSTSGKAALGEDGLDGQLLWGSGSLCEKCKERNEQQPQAKRKHSSHVKLPYMYSFSALVLRLKLMSLQLARGPRQIDGHGADSYAHPSCWLT